MVCWPGQYSRRWLDKVSEYETENCVESISESSEDETSHCFLKSEQSTPNRRIIPISEYEENKYKTKNVIKQCSCLKTNSVPLDSEYFDSIIPPISLLYKDKNKVQMIQNKNIKNIQAVNLKKLKVRRRNK